MKIYIYNRDTKEFLYSSVAQPNPKKRGEYLYPPNSTTKTPPIHNKNEAVLFKNGDWLIVPDYRGISVINLISKEVSTVDYLGELADDMMLYSDYQQTDDYKEGLLAEQKIIKRNEILSQIKEIDEKRIRAVCEPSYKSASLTWLDYYNSKIAGLRTKLAEVENDN